MVAPRATPPQRKAAGRVWALACVALAAPVLVFIASFGVKFGWWDAALGHDLLTLTVAWGLAFVGGLAALGALVLSLRDPRRLLAPALVAMIVAGVTLGLFVHQKARFASGAPQDVSSDAAEPPGFSDLIASARRRAGAVAVGAPAGPDACPDARSAPTQVAPETARAALEAAGFQVLGAAPFRAEGTRDGFWFGFGHDAVIRIRPGRTDIRVAARNARPDGGEACRLAGVIADSLVSSG
jgi:hypothetical protein